MKSIITLTVCFSVLACTPKTNSPEEKPASDSAKNPETFMTHFRDTSLIRYDTSFVNFTGADEYGMKQYVMAFLKRGPKRDQDSATAAALQKAHLENIGRMAEEGKLIVAGPFMDDQDIRGIYIFNVSSVEEAEALTKTDPAIQAGRLEMELHPWYGSAALILNPGLHSLGEKKNVAD